MTLIFIKYEAEEYQTDLGEELDLWSSAAPLGCPTGQTPALTAALTWHPSRLCGGQFANLCARASFSLPEEAGGWWHCTVHTLSGQCPFNCAVF